MSLSTRIAYIEAAIFATILSFAVAVLPHTSDPIPTEKTVQVTA